MSETATTPSEVIDAINNLIEVNRDAQDGFKEATEKLEAPHLKDFFREQSRSRVHFVGELQPELKESLPAPVRAIVERQFQSVKQAHDKVKELRDQLDK